MLKKVEIRLEIDVPDNATNQQIEDWVSFQVGLLGSCSGDNPMVDMDLDPLWINSYVSVD